MVDDKKNALRFRTLYAEHSPAILKYALRRCYDSELAADVLAETFVVAWLKIDQVPKGKEGRYWLYAVARKIFANHHRKQINQRNLASTLKQHLKASVEPLLEEQFTDEFAVSEALSILAPDELELIRLATWEGFKSSEISKICGIPAVTVRTRLFRVRSKLKKELEKSFDDLGTLAPPETYTNTEAPNDDFDRKEVSFEHER